MGFFLSPSSRTYATPTYPLQLHPILKATSLQMPFWSREREHVVSGSAHTTLNIYLGELMLH